MQHIFEFIVQVWKGAGPILGTGVLLYLAFLLVKTVGQEVETMSDVLLLLLGKCEHQLLGAISSVRRLWRGLKAFREKAANAWRAPDPPRNSRSRPRDVGS